MDQGLLVTRISLLSLFGCAIPIHFTPLSGLQNWRSQYCIRIHTQYNMYNIYIFMNVQYDIYIHIIIYIYTYIIIYIYISVCIHTTDIHFIHTVCVYIYIYTHILIPICGKGTSLSPVAKNGGSVVGPFRRGFWLLEGFRCGGYGC